MAETVVPLAIQDITHIKFLSGNTTPKEYTVKPTEGTVDLIQGEYEHMVATDAAGVPLSGTAPRQAGVRAMCGIRFACKLFDIGDNAETDEYTLLDVLDNDGEVGSDWVSTTDSPDASMYTWDIEVKVKDRTIGSTTVRGATIVIPNVRIEGNQSISVTRDGGWMLDATFRSTTAVKYTKTRTSA